MAKGNGKPCGASHISRNKACRIGLPSAVNAALNKASLEVGIHELVVAAKKAGGKGAGPKVEAIRAQMREENPGANLKAGEQGREFKRRLREAGLIPAKGAPKSENAADIFNKNIKPAPEAPKTLPSDLKKELAALAARDQQVIDPKEAVKVPSAKPDSLYGSYPTADLKNARDYLSIAGETTRLKKAEAELARRAKDGKSAKTDPFLPLRWGDSEDKLPSAREDLMALRREKLLKRFGSATEGEAKKLDLEILKIDRALGLGVPLGPSNPATKIPTGSATGNTAYAKREAADFDKNFKPASRQGGTYDWNETTKPGTKKIGEGSFGTVLMTKGPPPVAVKRGEISAQEAAIIKKVGEAGIGPRLIAGELAGGGRMQYGVKLGDGRIAMSVVPGKELMDMRSDTKIGNTTAGDAYWAARANLHRMGIAHNDMHPGNLLIDEKGKGRWVDMGLANDSPGAALAEALGVLERPRGSVGVGKGDWQGQGYARQTGNNGTRATSSSPENLKRMQSNHDTKVLPFLRSKGLDNDEIGEVMTLGLRAKPSQYTTGGFAKLSASDALEAINLLYDGI